MPQIQLFDHDGRPLGAWLDTPAARRVLSRLGIDSGRLAPPERPLSRLPQLTYARELADLRRRFNTAMTYRTWRRADDPMAVLGEPAGRSARSSEPEFGHTHDDHELRVVLQGQLIYFVPAPAPALPGWAAVVAGPGSWIALPPGLPHTLEAVPAPELGLDVLSLFSKPAGWIPRAAGIVMPPALTDASRSAGQSMAAPPG